MDSRDRSLLKVQYEKGKTRLMVGMRMKSNLYEQLLLWCLDLQILIYFERNVQETKK